MLTKKGEMLNMFYLIRGSYARLDDEMNNFKQHFIHAVSSDNFSLISDLELVYVGHVYMLTLRPMTF